ncbi:ABC transporter substrate-binding protein [Christiangramia aquimixticola]|uniref:ABC transporter substrate-binding protein n=1 Tax=Christiangramia aquimixticola TaxID=1697558 RepID=UPI003AA8D593
MKFQDQLHREIELETVPKRIISLVPSQTELLVDLGLESSIIGITHFCVHPASLRDSKTAVGGTKKVNFRKVRELKPDLILCNKEENTKEMVEELMTIAPVHCSDISDLEDNAELIRMYGEIFDCEEKASDLNRRIDEKVKDLQQVVENSREKKVAYFIWKKPWMIAGKGTFIDKMLQLNKFENICSKARYPEISLEKLKNKTLDLCLLSSEPFPFEEKHKEIFTGLADEVLIVDGEYFSWYGSRLIKAMDYFKSLHS